MLSQLVYVSTRSSTCTSQEIEKILTSCKKNNPSLGITGILLYTDKKFIQLVEGDAKVILDLYDKIKMDKRHSNAMMITYNPIKEKSFPSWHMASRDISNGELGYKTEISSTDRQIFDKVLSGKEENGEKVLNLLKKFF
jgi:hypothetical protein